MDKNRWIGRKVFVQLKGQRKYSGIVLEIEGTEIPFLITIKDKYDKYVSFLSSEIEVLQEEERG